MNRPSWDATIYEIIEALEKRSTCYKLHVAGVLFNPITKDILCGYNGAPSGHPHCIDSQPVLDGSHHINCLHVEDNLSIKAGREAKGCILYLSCNPCRRCTLKIIQMQVDEVVYRDFYNESDDFLYAAKQLAHAHILLRKYTPQEPDGYGASLIKKDE